MGVAFPAPHWDDPRQQGFFDLVNLPTPRQQIAYSYYVKTDPAARLAKLSRRTLDRFLAEKKLLSDAELGMLAQLEAREVSRFANRYLLLVDDGMVDEDLNQRCLDQPQSARQPEQPPGRDLRPIGGQRHARGRAGAPGGHPAEALHVAHAARPLPPAMAGGFFDRPPRSMAGS